MPTASPVTRYVGAPTAPVAKPRTEGGRRGVRRPGMREPARASGIHGLHLEQQRDTRRTSAGAVTVTSRQWTGRRVHGRRRRWRMRLSALGSHSARRPRGLFRDTASVTRTMAFPCLPLAAHQPCSGQVRAAFTPYSDNFKEQAPRLDVEYTATRSRRAGTCSSACSSRLTTTRADAVASVLRRVIRRIRTSATIPAVAM
jgi:hypothetical protein